MSIENRGGRREGAGRKRIFEISEAKRKEILKDIAAIAKEHDSSIGKELGNMIFGLNKDRRLKMQAIQVYLRDLLPKSSERDVTVTKIQKPQIFIPEKYPDTAEAPDFKTKH